LQGFSRFRPLIPHITHALYLLTQDGCDLLKVAQQRMLNWKAPA